MKLLVAVLLSVLLGLAIADFNPICLLDLDLDSPTAQYLQARFVNLTTDLDLIEAQYGTTTGPLSFSSGSAGVLNPLLVAQMSAQFAARLTSDPAVGNLVYFEKDSDTVNITVTGIPTIALDLAEFAVIPCQLIVPPVPPAPGVYLCEALYGEYQSLGGMLVQHIGNNLFQVSAADTTVGRVPDSSQASTFPAGYPTSDSQMVSFTIYGVRAHTYSRVCSNGVVTFYLTEIDTGLKYDFHGPAPAAFYNGNPYKSHL